MRPIIAAAKAWCKANGELWHVNEEQTEVLRNPFVVVLNRYTAGCVYAQLRVWTKNDGWVCEAMIEMPHLAKLEDPDVGIKTKCGGIVSCERVDALREAAALVVAEAEALGIL